MTQRTAQRYVCRAVMPNVKFVVEHQVVEVQAGRTLREIALEAGVYPNREWFRGFNCGGRGLCGTCKVWVKESKAGAASSPTLSEKLRGLGDGRRLACQTRVMGDLELTTFPGGGDRTAAGRQIDPAPIRPEAAAEQAKPATPAAKDGAAADKKAAKPAEGTAPAVATKAAAREKADTTS